MNYVPFGQNKEHLFRKYQQLLIWFANTKEGRDYLQEKVDIRWTGPIDLVVPAGFHTILEYGNKGTPKKIYFQFHPRNPIEQILLPVLKRLDIYVEFMRDEVETQRAFLTLLGILPKSSRSRLWIPSAFLANFGPFSPVSGNNSPIDGYVFRGSVDETFGTIRAGAGNGTDTTLSSQTMPILFSSGTTNQFSGLYRAIICYDTSSLLSGSTVNTATNSLSSYTNPKGNSIGSPDIHTTGATPASTSALANSDYGQVQFTSFSSVTYANWSSTDAIYNDFSLNASGISNISVTGVSKFGIILDWDLNNSFTGSWVASNNSHVGFYFADNGSNKPKLSGTYTAAGGGSTISSYKSLLGVGQA